MFPQNLLIIYLTLFTLTVSKHRYPKNHKDLYLDAPRSIGPGEEKYKYKNGKSIILSNIHRTWLSAKHYCYKEFNAELIKPVTEELAFFLAEVLAETDMDLDNMWIGLTKKGWIDGKSLNKRSKIMKYFLKRGSYHVLGVRGCYSFTSFNHSVPQFIDLNCGANRGCICMLG